jgi:hypothetical protein
MPAQDVTVQDMPVNVLRGRIGWFRVFCRDRKSVV